ncbi:MAG: DUF2459 domain-containing protein [Balneolaceae bacterium]|nr:DUF2459 domain-containing protein [Balneolaceae bacterium]
MKLIVHILKWVVGIPLSLILLYLFLAIALSLISISPEQEACEPQRDIYLANNGIHLFLVVPVDKLKPDFRTKLMLPQDAAFAAFGWGDRSFYLQTPTWSELKIPVALRALFVPSDAAIHVSFDARERASWRAISLCDHQVDRLLKYIREHLTEREGHFISLEAEGYGPGNRFYRARGKYTLFMTSNEWVNRGLKRAGVRTAVWSPFPFGVWHRLQEKKH